MMQERGEQATFNRNMYSAPSEPWMVSLRGRCLLVMTVSWGAKAAMVTTGAPAMYVPGTASSRPCSTTCDLKGNTKGSEGCKSLSDACRCLFPFHEHQSLSKSCQHYQVM